MFSTERRDNALWISLSGPLDAGMAKGLDGIAGAEAASVDVRAVIVDLAGVTAMQSAGIAFLVKLRTMTATLGKPLLLRDPSVAVQDALTRRELSHFFQIIDGDVDDFDEDELASWAAS